MYDLFYHCTCTVTHQVISHSSPFVNDILKDSPYRRKNDEPRKVKIETVEPSEHRKAFSLLKITAILF